MLGLQRAGWISLDADKRGRLGSLCPAQWSCLLLWSPAATRLVSKRPLGGLACSGCNWPHPLRYQDVCSCIARVWSIAFLFGHVKHHPTHFMLFRSSSLPPKLICSTSHARALNQHCVPESPPGEERSTSEPKVMHWGACSAEGCGAGGLGRVGLDARAHAQVCMHAHAST